MPASEAQPVTADDHLLGLMVTGRAYVGGDVDADIAGDGDRRLVSLGLASPATSVMCSGKGARGCGCTGRVAPQGTSRRPIGQGPKCSFPRVALAEVSTAP